MGANGQYYTALHTACKVGCIGNVKHLLKYVAKRGEEGWNKYDVNLSARHGAFMRNDGWLFMLELDSSFGTRFRKQSVLNGLVALNQDRQKTYKFITNDDINEAYEARINST